MVEISGSSRYQINRLRLKLFGQKLLEQVGQSGQNLSIALVGRRKMRELMAQYHPAKQTLPVLSFPYFATEGEPEEMKMWGEVVICYPLGVLLAAEKNKTVQVMFESLVEHGVETISKNIH